MDIKATFVKADGSSFHKRVDWKGSDYFFPMPVQYGMNFNGESRADKPVICPVEVYEHLGELPTGFHIFSLKKIGMWPFVIDQYFRGPNKNTLMAWERTIGSADRELHQWMIHHCGTAQWPGKPQLPPYVKLHEELRFITDACETHQKPYMFMYHRRTQGVGVKRIM